MALAISLALTACSSGETTSVAPPASASPGSSSTTSAVIADGTPALGSTQSGDVTVSLFTSPAPPARGQGTLVAFVTDAAGQPISDAAVSFDIDMTNMSHGKDVVAATPSGGGYYSGDVFFLMPGPWRVIVGIESDGHETSVRIDFMVR